MKSYRLGDVIRIKHGYAFSGEGISTDDNGCVLVTPGNFKIGGGFQEEKCKFFEGEYPEEYVLKSGDHIVTMTDLSKTIDTLGYSAIVPANKKRIYLHNQRIGLITYINDELDPLYINYLMRSRSYQVSIANTSTGSTVHHTSPDKIYDYIFEAPDLELQKQIAGILSAYDTLIENNRKQIKLLEEAARRLYKEWFVDLRFPGHEHTPIVNGIPEGWRKGELSSIASFVRGKTITQAKTLPGCIPVVAGGLTPAYYHNTANTRPPVITVSASGANAGYVALYHTPIWASDCSFIDSTKSEHLYYLYCLLKEHQAEINNFRKGSAQPHVHPNQINGLELLVPHMKFIRQFEQSTAALFGKIRTLNTQNELLTEARDRLLPKLMSGEIAIK